MRISDWSSDVCSSDLRTDVMTYQTPVLTQAVRVSGAPIADLFAKTTGTDGDFVVKVIDVLPPENATAPKMGGYPLAISLDIFRGRYSQSFEHHSPIPAPQIQDYQSRLLTENTVFQPQPQNMV